jgi:hypothetical protein
MSWHKLTLKVSDVLALLGQRCLGTYHVTVKESLKKKMNPNRRCRVYDKFLEPHILKIPRIFI